MRAVGLTEFGPPEVLCLVEPLDPNPGPGEVLIRAERLRDVAPWHVPGMDAAIVVPLRYPPGPSARHW